jgi:hypothetical protein
MAIIICAVVVVVTFTSISWGLGRRAVEEFCTSITAGASVDRARERAAAARLRFRLPGVTQADGTHMVFVTSSRVMGRHVCEVTHDGAKVIETRMRFND